MSSPRARLLRLLSELSWRKGPVTLASGKVSDFYIDCKQTALNAEGAALIGQLTFEHVQTLRNQGLRVDGVGGLTLGADPLAVATAVYSFIKNDPVHAFIIRKDPKDHGTAVWVEGAKNVPSGSSVLILEDVVTSGGSGLKAIERARANGLVPIAIFALIDRQEGGRENLAKTGLPFASLFSRSDFKT